MVNLDKTTTALDNWGLFSSDTPSMRRSEHRNSPNDLTSDVDCLVTDSKTGKLISIVVPFYNEEATIAVFYSALTSTIDAITDMQWEIVCIDDGSVDATLQILIELAQADHRVQVIELSRNFGKEAALTAGIDAAKGDAVIPMDADLQDPPELISQLIEAWQSGGEMVLARRIERNSDSFLKRITSHFFYRAHNQICKTKLPEDVGDFRLMDRIVVDALKRLPERQRFMKGLFAWVGFRTLTIEYSRPARKNGATKFSGASLWDLAVNGFTSFSTAPLKIWTYIGFTGTMATFLYGLFIIAYQIIHGTNIPGYASLIVIILFLGSVQLMSIGILGEYIGRIYLETKQRPSYLVRKWHEGNNGT